MHLKWEFSLAAKTFVALRRHCSQAARHCRWRMPSAEFQISRCRRNTAQKLNTNKRRNFFPFYLSVSLSEQHLTNRKCCFYFCSRALSTFIFLLFRCFETLCCVCVSSRVCGTRQPGTIHLFRATRPLTKHSSLIVRPVIDTDENRLNPFAEQARDNPFVIFKLSNGNKNNICFCRLSRRKAALCYAVVRALEF